MRLSCSQQSHIDEDRGDGVLRALGPQDVGECGDALVITHLLRTGNGQRATRKRAGESVYSSLAASGL